MNKITVIAVVAASFFAGLFIGQLIGSEGGFGCNNGNTVVNNYGRNEDICGNDEDDGCEDYAF